MRTIILALACALLACSQPSPTPAPAGSTPPPVPVPSLSFTGPPRRAIPTSAAKKIDARTPEQAANDACQGPDGRWLCPKLAHKALLASSGSQPITPASWSVGAWWIDPANSTGCASDNNSGTSAACGAAGSGIGPLKTWGELQVHRWGCFGTSILCPALNQATTVTFLSSQSSPWNDPVNVSAVITSTGTLVITGTASTATTATIGAFTARNRTSGTKNTITASGQSGSYWTPYVGHLVHDTTKDAYFWIQHDNGTATASISEPLALTTGFNSSPTYVTIANGDSLSILNLPHIRMDRFSWAGGNATSTFYASFVEIDGSAYDMTRPFGANFNQVKFDQYFWAMQDGSGAATTMDNCFFDANGLFAGASVSLFGGALESNFPQIGYAAGQAELDADVLIDSATVHFGGLLEIGRVYFAGGIDTAASIGNSLYVGPLAYADGEQWGPCAINVVGGGKMFVSGPTTAMLCTGGYKIDGATTAFPWVSASNAYGAAVSVTPANINSDNGLSNPATGSQILIGSL